MIVVLKTPGVKVTGGRGLLHIESHNIEQHALVTYSWRVLYNTASNVAHKGSAANKTAIVKMRDERRQKCGGSLVDLQLNAEKSKLRGERLLR